MPRFLRSSWFKLLLGIACTSVMTFITMAINLQEGKAITDLSLATEKAGFSMLDMLIVILSLYVPAIANAVMAIASRTGYRQDMCRI